jgi:hypothetical protein
MGLGNPGMGFGHIAIVDYDVQAMGLEPMRNKPVDLKATSLTSRTRLLWDFTESRSNMIVAGSALCWVRTSDLTVNSRTLYLLS